MANENNTIQITQLLQVTSQYKYIYGEQYSLVFYYQKSHVYLVAHGNY